jgi:PiT family inorganic phosphate transporter
MDARSPSLLVALIGVALAFDFLNGLHDAANSIATIVSTRVLKPQYAVAGRPSSISSPSCSSACMWPRRWARASSIAGSSIDLGDLRGADGGDHLERHHLGLRHPVVQFACADRRLSGRGHGQGGLRAVQWSGLFKTVRHLPVADDGLHAGADPGADRVVDLREAHAGLRRPVFRKLQFVSASLYSLGHGGNDAQKTMGIIAVLLYSAGHDSAASSMCRSGW